MYEGQILVTIDALKQRNINSLSVSLSVCCNQTSNILFAQATSEVTLEEKVRDVIFVFQLQNNLRVSAICGP